MTNTTKTPTSSRVLSGPRGSEFSASITARWTGRASRRAVDAWADAIVARVEAAGIAAPRFYVDGPYSTGTGNSEASVSFYVESAAVAAAIAAVIA
jgi:hypothetical protein